MKSNNKHTIDGTKMVAEDIAEILNKYRMCDISTEKDLILISDHTGLIIKEIKLN